MNEEVQTNDIVFIAKHCDSSTWVMGEYTLNNYSTTQSRDYFGSRVPRDEITFFAQVIIVYVVIVRCIINLSIGNGESNLWTALFSSCLGYILPSTKLKNHSVLR